MKLAPKQFFLSISLVILAISSYAQGKKNAHDKDGEAIGFLIAVNSHEIDMSQAAKKGGIKDPAVVQFADLMIEQHTKNLKDTKKLSKDSKITARETHAIKTLKEHGNKEQKKLKKLKGKKLETTFIDAMVKGHSDVLNKIDTFLPQILNAALKTHLTQTRAVVVDHLSRAKKIQDSQKAKP